MVFMVSLLLALSQCVSLRSGLKRPFDTAVQRPQHGDTRMHHVVAIFGGADQTFDRGLPFLKLLRGLGQACDVAGGIAQSKQLAPTRQQDRIIEEASPSGNTLQLRSAIRHHGCAERSIGVLLRGFDCRAFRADCSAFLSRSRSSFNSEI
jgi:hypothetical protein